MKKIISAIVSCVLVMTMGAAASFAAEKQDEPAAAQFSDVAGTPYEKAVVYLTEKGVIDGFEDGTFRPQGIVTRAQACKMIAQMLGAAEDELKAAAESAAKSFSDIEASDWAAPYIGYCVEKGIAAGYPDQSFKGSKQITLAEYAALLCRADGDSDSSLGGAWPDNYMESAKDKGFLENLVDCDPAADAQKSLTRGNTAVMTYNCMTAQDSEDPDSGKDDGDDQKPADRLDDFSGRAFGIILETGSTLNKKDEIVGSITFLMGDGVHEVLTNTGLKDSVNQYSGDNALVYLQMSNGVVKKIVPVDESVETSDGVQCILTAVSDDSSPLFSKVERRSDSLVRYYTGTDSETEHFLAAEDQCIVYTCSPDGNELVYETGTLSDVYEGCYVIAYTIDDETEGAANVLIVIDESDAEDLLNIEGNSPATWGGTSN